MSELAPMTPHKKLNELDLEKLCRLLRSGYTVQNACNKVGISVRSYNKWRLLGQDPEEEVVFQNFYFKTEQARYQSINRLVDVLYDQAHAGDTKVTMWLLERLYPEHFSLKEAFRPDKVDIKAETQEDVPIVHKIEFADKPTIHQIQAEKVFYLRNALKEKGLEEEYKWIIELYQDHILETNGINREEE